MLVHIYNVNGMSYASGILETIQQQGSIAGSIHHFEQSDELANEGGFELLPSPRRIRGWRIAVGAVGERAAAFALPGHPLPTTGLGGRKGLCRERNGSSG